MPVKDFDRAKTRLSGLLEPEARRQLSRAMLWDVLTAAAAATGLAGVLVVTRDPEAADMAASAGARVLIEAASAGPSAAVAAAARLLSAERRAGMFAIMGDVPLVTPSGIDRVLRIHGSGPAVTLVPAGNGRGSNAVVCSPPEAIPLSFDGGSFSWHLETARRLGIAPKVVRLPDLGLDVDRPEDLSAFMERRSHTRAAGYLAKIGMAGRPGASLGDPGLMRGRA